MGWSSEQRRLLVECAFHMTRVTGHDFTECVYELRELKKRYVKGEVDEEGKEK